MAPVGRTRRAAAPILSVILLAIVPAAAHAASAVTASPANGAEVQVQPAPGFANGDLPLQWSAEFPGCPGPDSIHTSYPERRTAGGSDTDWQGQQRGGPFFGPGTFSTPTTLFPGALPVVYEWRVRWNCGATLGFAGAHGFSAVATFTLLPLQSAPGGAVCTTDDLLAEREGCTGPCDDALSASELADEVERYDRQAVAEIEQRADQEAVAARRGDRAGAARLLDKVRDLQADRARTLRGYEDLLARKVGAAGCGMSAEQLASLARLVQQRAGLARRLAEMERAVQELRDRTDVFCAVSNGMLEISTGTLPDPVQNAVGDGWDNVCGKIPRAIESHVDAEAKMQQVRDAIEQLDAMIRELRAGPSPLSATLQQRAVAPATPMAAGNPLAALASRRAEAVRAMRAVTQALRRRDPAGAQRLAGIAARALTRVPAARATARRYLDRTSMGTSA